MQGRRTPERLDYQCGINVCEYSQKLRVGILTTVNCLLRLHFILPLKVLLFHPGLAVLSRCDLIFIVLFICVLYSCHCYRFSIWTFLQYWHTSWCCRCLFLPHLPNTTESMYTRLRSQLLSYVCLFVLDKQFPAKQPMVLTADTLTWDYQSNLSSIAMLPMFISSILTMIHHFLRKALCRAFVIRVVPAWDCCWVPVSTNTFYVAVCIKCGDKSYSAIIIWDEILLKQFLLIFE